MAKDNKSLAVATAQRVMDGWKNVLTGLGVRGKDRRKDSTIEWKPTHESDIEEFYAASDTARKVTDEIVHEAFREGYKLKSDDITPELLSKITDEENRLGVNEKIQEAWKLARMHGGSAIIPIPRDVKLLAQPFVPEALDKIMNLLVLSRWELPRQELETDVRSPNFATPKTYRITPRTGADQMNFEVHHTWMIRFDGAYLPRHLYFKNNLWHDSVLNVCKEPIRDYDAALSAISATLDDFSVGVMKIKGLTAAISEDRDDLITKRLSITNLSRSIAKMIVIDADSESFEYQDRQLSGVADCARLVAGRLVVASNMPHTKILGESPEGSNATGNSTTKDWYDHVRAQQKGYLDPRLLKLWGWIFAAKKGPTSGAVPKGLSAIYAPLWQEPESVQADVRLKQAQTDNLYISTGVLEPAEVTISRFGSGEYSRETQLIESRPDTPAKLSKSKKEPLTPEAPPEKNATKSFEPNTKATASLEEKEASV